MNINYDHALDNWKVDSAHGVLPVVFEEKMPNSLLDVGCGPGTWLKAAMGCGIGEVVGIDGVVIPDHQLFVPKGLIHQQDLTQTWNLGRVFDIALCLEVAEHLDAQWASRLIGNLTAHSNMIIFSAACPGQPGYHHVNCQWPLYWQELFNREGFACYDALRWQIWDNVLVEPWYRQNIFLACRKPEEAGKEKRLASVIHPELLPFLVKESNVSAAHAERKRIEHGSMSPNWYATVPFTALLRKLGRRLSVKHS